MSFVIKQSESGDWFLVPYLKKDQFLEDELNGNASYADYIGDPSQVRILDYEIE